MSTNSSNRCPRAFTLIELLVVVAIIALLVAILVPALQGARRQAKLVGCSSNLHQIGVGLAIYLSEWGEYPPENSFSVSLIYTREGGLDRPPMGFDNRQNLVDIVDGAAKDIYFCPFNQFYRPEESPFINEFSDYFYVDDHGSGLDRHMVGYNMLFLVTSKNSWFNFDFSNSGNPGGERPVPGDSNSAIIADINHWDAGDQVASFHSDNYSEAGGSSEFRDSNCLYGDGHVVTRTSIEYYIVRNGSSCYGY